MGKISLLLLVVSSACAFAKGGKDICDASPLSRLCNLATFAPHPDPQLNAIYVAEVQPTLDTYAADHGDMVLQPGCNWRGMSVNDLTLDCAFRTLYSKKFCRLEMKATFQHVRSSITCE